VSDIVPWRVKTNQPRLVSSTPTLKKLARQLEEQTKRSQGQEDSFRFLYFNHMNLALKTTLNSRNSPLLMEVIKLIRQIHADFKRF